MLKNTHTMAVLFAAAMAILLFAGCESEVGNDARQTPIGSVLSGDTRDSGEYFRKVREGNAGRQSDTWRPENPGQF